MYSYLTEKNLLKEISNRTDTNKIDAHWKIRPELPEWAKISETIL